MSDPAIDKTIEVRLFQQRDYQIRVEFGDGIADLTADEPPPLGANAGPSPLHLLASAVGSCLSDSLLFALRKFRQAPEPMSCVVHADVGRNAERRLRVLGIRATLSLGVPAAQLQHLDRVLAQFEEYCTVTQSVRQGIPVSVQVFDSTGAQLK